MIGHVLLFVHNIPSMSANHMMSEGFTLICCCGLCNFLGADYRSHNPDDHNMKTQIAGSNQRACVSYMSV